MRRVYLSRHFLKQLKPYLKKFRNLENNLIATLEHFRLETADPLGQKLYKVRLKLDDMPKGKNTSFRLIVFLLETRNILTPITIYFKSEQSDISEKEIEYHLAMVVSEIQRKESLTE